MLACRHRIGARQAHRQSRAREQWAPGAATDSDEARVPRGPAGRSGLDRSVCTRPPGSPAPSNHSASRSPALSNHSASAGPGPASGRIGTRPSILIRPGIRDQTRTSGPADACRSSGALRRSLQLEGAPESGLDGWPTEPNSETGPPNRSGGRREILPCAAGPNVRVMARVGACILAQVPEGTAGGRDGGRRRAVLSLQPCVASESLHFP